MKSKKISRQLFAGTLTAAMLITTIPQNLMAAENQTIVENTQQQNENCGESATEEQEAVKIEEQEESESEAESPNVDTDKKMENEAESPDAGTDKQTESETEQATKNEENDEAEPATEKAENDEAEPVTEKAENDEAKPATAAETAVEVKAGTPYKEDGTYDVSVPHVVINQIYGGGKNGNASHSFVELYNQSKTEVDLSGWQLSYRSSEDGEEDAKEWKFLSLEGKIAGEGYFLVRCKATGGTDYPVPDGDMEWDIALHNKGVSVALFDRSTEIPDTFAGAVNENNRPAGYVDVLAAQGNDGEETQIPPVYEGGYSAIQSKKKAVRRVDFADTDDNSSNGEEIDYSKPETVTEEQGPHNSATKAPDSGDTGDNGNNGDTGEGGAETPTPVYREESFATDAALTLAKTGAVQIGEAQSEGGVAEIVTYNEENHCAYVVNGHDGVLEVLYLDAAGALSEKKEIELKELPQDDFVYGDMTSVSIDTDNDRIAVALQAKDYSETGRVAVMDYDGTLLKSYKTGVQPDMVTFAGAGRYILTANEGEPREGYGDGIVDPAGSVSIIDTMTGDVKLAGFEEFDSKTLAEDGILFNKVNGEILSAAQDLEPEYIAVNAAGTKAYVSLQEANAIGILDLEKKKFTDIKGLGFIDYSLPENAVDLEEDNMYAPQTYVDAYGVRMSDGISLYETKGKTYLLTANEGDAREWGSGNHTFKNETKETLQKTDGGETEKVRVLNHDVTAGLSDGKNYLFGGRSFSIFDADTMELVFDSKNQFEQKTAEYLPEWFNCSNDNLKIDSRSKKKGPEPETVITGRIGNNFYAFVALERIGGIMVYDITNPANASYVNYINTRDFSGKMKGEVAPEGLAFVPSYSTDSGKPVLLAACEVSGTVAAYALDGSATNVPTPKPQPTPRPQPTPTPQPQPTPQTTTAPQPTPQPQPTPKPRPAPASPQSGANTVMANVTDVNRMRSPKTSETNLPAYASGLFLLAAGAVSMLGKKKRIK